MPKNNENVPAPETLFDTDSLAAQHPDEPFAKVNRPVSPPEAPQPYEGPLPSQMDIDDVRAEMEEDVDRLADLGGFTYRIAKDKEVGPVDKPVRATPADKSGQPQEKADDSKKIQKGDRPIDRSKLSARDRAVADGPPDHIRKQNRERGIY